MPFWCELALKEKARSVQEQEGQECSAKRVSAFRIPLKSSVKNAPIDHASTSTVPQAHKVLRSLDSKQTPGFIRKCKHCGMNEGNDMKSKTVFTGEGLEWICSKCNLNKKMCKLSIESS